MSSSGPIDKSMLAMNEALLLGSLRQHELTEAAENLNAKLLVEIAERAHAETAFRESEGRFRTLFELGPTAVYSCDVSGTILEFNQSAVELWGREPVLGNPDERYCGSFKLFRPNGSFMPPAQCPMADVILGKIPEVRDGEVLIERPDGTRISVIVNIRPLKNARGEITGAINCFYDITGRKLEEEIRHRLTVLTTSNRKLENEIIRRKTVEEALRKSEGHERRLRDRSRQLAHQVLHSQEEERLRISRELHDQVVQTLVGINVRLIALNQHARSVGGKFHEQLTEAQNMVERSVETVHQFSRDLRPTLLDDLGLIPTLRAFLKTYMAETGIRTRLTVFAGVEKLEGALLTILYRVIQEALTNVARHAKSHAVEINIQESGDEVCMTIRDNGQGFKPVVESPPKKSRRLGLIGMQERLEMVGGTFDIRSVEGEGTTVTATIPIPPPEP
jgi:signal transduction histidine kinase